MTARNTLAISGPVVGPTFQLPAVNFQACAPVARKTLVVLRNTALFLVSPFIGLAYAALLPLVGIGMLLWAATEGLRTDRAKRAELAAAVKFAGKLVAAPFAGLAFIVAMPFVAAAALAWVGFRALAIRTS